MIASIPTLQSWQDSSHITDPLIQRECSLNSKCDPCWHTSHRWLSSQKVDQTLIHQREISFTSWPRTPTKDDLHLSTQGYFPERSINKQATQDGSVSLMTSGNQKRLQWPRRLSVIHFKAAATCESGLVVSQRWKPCMLSIVFHTDHSFWTCLISYWAEVLFREYFFNFSQSFKIKYFQYKYGMIYAWIRFRSKNLDIVEE